MKDFTTFTTEYKEQMKKNAFIEVGNDKQRPKTATAWRDLVRKNANIQVGNDPIDQKAVEAHDFYADVTAAGMPRYLDREDLDNKHIRMPQELHKAIVEGKTGEVWRQIALLPILQRPKDDDGDLAIQNQGTMLSQMTSASASKKAAAALAVKIQEEQLKELTDE